MKATIVELPSRVITLITDDQGNTEITFARSKFNAKDVARDHGAGDIIVGGLECLDISLLQPVQQSAPISSAPGPASDDPGGPTSLPDSSGPSTGHTSYTSGSKVSRKGKRKPK